VTSHNYLCISHENDAWLRLQAPEFIRWRAVLEHLELIGPDGCVDVTLEKPGEAPFTLSVKPDDPRVATPHYTQVLRPPTPLYRSRPGPDYWFQYLADSQTLYIQYNVCRNDPKLPFADFAHQVLAEADAHPPRRVVIELRQNAGGNSRVIGPLPGGLRSRLRAIGHVYVLIGPTTFSSGVLNAMELQRDLHATLAGETAGGTPSSYGELGMLTLPNSKLVVQYTTKYFGKADDAKSSAPEPDLPVPFTLADALAGRDPVLAAVIGRNQLAHAPRHQRLRQSRPVAWRDPCIREQTRELVSSKQPDVVQIVLDVELPAVRRGALQPIPDGPPRNDRSLPGVRQQVNDRRKQVLLDREEPVGGLHPVPFAHPASLFREAPLILSRTDVLDHGIAEHDVERSIGERQVATVAGHELESFRTMLLRAGHV
jgi:hypothetical protein